VHEYQYKHTLERTAFCRGALLSEARLLLAVIFFVVRIGDGDFKENPIQSVSGLVWHVYGNGDLRTVFCLGALLLEARPFLAVISFVPRFSVIFKKSGSWPRVARVCEGRLVPGLAGH